MSFGVPTDKHQHSNSTQLLSINNLQFTSLNNTSDDEVMLFDSDSTNLYVDSCVTGGLTGFKSDFIEGSYVEVAERSSDTTTGKAVTIGEGVAAYTLKDDDGELCTLKTKMAYAPSRKFRLMAPQWLGMQER